MESLTIYCHYRWFLDISKCAGHWGYHTVSISVLYHVSHDSSGTGMRCGGSRSCSKGATDADTLGMSTWKKQTQLYL